MKMRFKRFLSGFMAVATLASVIVQPVTVSASELEPETTSFEQQYPELQDVQDTLDKDEIVEAKDIEIPYGEEFEVEVDLSGIEGVNEKKVKVLFHEAKSEAGTDFDAHTPDTYKAVYAVEPVSGHPAYRVSRNITVKEPETEAQTKSSSENTVGEGNAGETEDSDNAEEDVDSDGSMAPYGYLMAEEVSFTVDDTAEIQKVEMKDAVPTGTLIINKKGEFLKKVSALDSIGGWMKHLFEYLSGSLKDVTFEVYALEDIKAADGESEDYYKKDALVATITTDETGMAKLTDLPLGKYYVKEKETASGYVLDGETREVDLTYRDQNTAVVTYSADWQNKRQRAEVNVLKKEKDSDRVLEGAVFALCNKEDIVNAKGDVILKADTVIEEQATDKEGKLTFTADLPLGYTYYVKETSPAPGFATIDQVQEFTFEYGGADKETLSYAFTFEDEPTTVEFTKTSLTDGKEIEGAKLKVTDESGKTVDEWTSGKEPHIIKELTAGKKYTMTETLPADGYVTAESITFTVEDTSEVQKVEMKDDVTKVQISKTDISGKELPGAKLTILDKDGKTVESWTSEEKPHYIEMLPIGEYTLREETAPDGYLVAEDVKFTVKDTGEIQKVVMKDEAKPEETPTETPTETPETTPTSETKTTEETKKSTAPKTGDNTPILFWILLAGAGMAGLGGTVILRKKKK